MIRCSWSAATSWSASTATALLVKVGADRHGEALARGAQPWSMGRRTSSGMVEVPVTGLADPQALGRWVDWALRIAGPNSTERMTRQTP